MAIWNLGSINVDLFLQLDKFPAPGETIWARDFSKGLGGKGANISVAAARAAAHVHHIGVVGTEGSWTVERLLEYGVDTRHIRVAECDMSQAMVLVDASGENQIVLVPG